MSKLIRGAGSLFVTTTSEWAVANGFGTGFSNRLYYRLREVGQVLEVPDDVEVMVTDFTGLTHKISGKKVIVESINKFRLYADICVCNN